MKNLKHTHTHTHTHTPTPHNSTQVNLKVKRKEKKLTRIERQVILSEDNSLLNVYVQSNYFNLSVLHNENACNEKYLLKSNSNYFSLKITIEAFKQLYS